MERSLFFDTLDYSEQLAAGDIAHADVHAKGLSKALSQNIHAKCEVDKMIEDTYKWFNERTAKMMFDSEQARQKSEIKSERELAEFRREMQKIENRLDQKFNRHLITIIGVLGSLIVSVGTLATFAHHLV